MDTVLIVIHLLIAVALVCVVLMQRTAQDGGGLMGGSNTMGGLFTARGSANLLTRTTAILATLFIVMSLLLGMIAGHQHKAKGMAERMVPLLEQEQVEKKNESKSEEKAADQGKASVPSVPVSK